MLRTRNEEGERAVERLLTVVRNCQLQQLNAVAYLTTPSLPSTPSTQGIIAPTICRYRFPPAGGGE